MSTIEPWLIVTPQQLKQGWIRRVGSLLEGFVIERRSYLVLGQREDGNYVVRNPKLQILEEEMPNASHTRNHP